MIDVEMRGIGVVLEPVVVGRFARLKGTVLYLPILVECRAGLSSGSRGSRVPRGPFEKYYYSDALKLVEKDGLVKKYRCITSFALCLT